MICVISPIFFKSLIDTDLLVRLKFESSDIKLTNEIARGGYRLVYGAIRISTREDLLALKFFGYTQNRPLTHGMDNERDRANGQSSGMS